MNATAAPPTSKAPWIWGAVIAVVVIAGIAAVVAGSGSNDSEGDALESTTQQTSAAIEVEGTALPPLAEGDDAAIGETIPTVTGEGFDGEAITIGPDDGAKVIMVVAHWCPHCQKEVPIVVDHLEGTPMPDDVELVVVSTSVEESADNYPPSAWLDDAGLDVATMADTPEQTAAAALGTGGFPYFLAVDADGTVVDRTSGEISMERFDELVAAAQGASA